MESAVLDSSIGDTGAVGSPDGINHLFCLNGLIIAMLTRWASHAAATEFLSRLADTTTDDDTETESDTGANV